MARQQLSDLDFNSVARPTNIPNPVSSGDGVNKAYVDSLVEGLNWKDSVRASSTGNLNLASPGATIDGITMTSGDRFLAKDQTTQSANGIYIWNGAASAATRAADASTAAELEAAVVTVEEGTTNGGTSWRQTQVNFTLDTNNVIFTNFGTATPAATESVAGIAELATQTETDTGTDDVRIVTPLKLATSKWASKSFQANIGDGSATQYDITHNFNTYDVIVQVFRNSGNRDNIGCDVGRNSVNIVRLNFAAAPTSNQFRVVITRATNA
jgi:hypothetical protein